MTFTLTPAQFAKLEKTLIDSHQVVLTPKTESAGTMATVDGKIAADFTFDGAKNSLSVELTKHDGYAAFIANFGLKARLNAAIKSL